MALPDPSRDLRLAFDADAAREPARGSDLPSDSFATGAVAPIASSAALAEAENWLLHEAEARARAEARAAQAALERAAMEIGRASCREGVKIAGTAGACKRQEEKDS